MKYKLTIAYDGTPFAGWQIQPNGPTIQEEIEKALHQVTGKPIKVIGAGRTDAQVHAKGQVAHFVLETPPSPFLQKSLNALTPDEISILSIEPVDESFHARFSAKEKIYSYDVTTDLIQLPFDRNYSLHCTYPLSFDTMREAIKDLIGKHDFSAFANHGFLFNEGKNPIKTLYAIDIVQHDSGFALVFRGNGFLYKMVRNLTGLLIEIGRGKLYPSDAKKILESRDRKQAPSAAPAHGLTLYSIRY